jgi:hypothetical protein
VISIETLFDIDDLFMKEITTRLKAIKDDGGVTGGEMVRNSTSGTKNGWSATSRRNRRAVVVAAAPVAATRDVAGRTSDRTRPPSSCGSDKCRRSGKNGHWARECRSKPKREE